MKAIADPVGKCKKLAVTIEFDRLLRGIEDYLAVMAALQMNLKHLSQLIVQIPIQIARNLLDCIFTIHEYLTSFKNLA